MGKQIRTLSCLVGHMLSCLNVRVNDEAGKRGVPKSESTFNESTYLDLIDKFVVLKEPHQNNCTAGGLYEGLVQPSRDDIRGYIC